MRPHYTSCSLIFILPLVLSIPTSITNSNSFIVTDHGRDNNLSPGELVYLFKFGEIFQFCFDIRTTISRLLSDINSHDNYVLINTNTNQIITRLSNMLLNNQRSIDDLNDILHIYISNQTIDSGDITNDNSVVLNDSIRNSYAKYQVQHIYNQFKNNNGTIIPENLITIEIAMYAIQSQLKSLYADLQQLVYFKRLTPNILSYKQFKNTLKKTKKYKNTSDGEWVSYYRHCELDIFKYYDHNYVLILAFRILTKASSNQIMAMTNNSSNSLNESSYLMPLIFCAFQFAGCCVIIIILIMGFCERKNQKQQANTPCHYTIKYNDDDDDDDEMDKLPTEKEEKGVAVVEDLKSRIDGNYTSYKTPTYVDYSFEKTGM